MEKLRDSNYKLPELLKKIRRLIKRDGALLGDVLQRTVVFKRDGKAAEHAITRIDILGKGERAFDPRAWSEAERDYGQIRFIQERIQIERLLTRLKKLSTAKFSVKRTNFTFPTVSYCQNDFHPRNNEYSDWAGTLFDIGVGAVNTYFVHETLLHRYLPTYDTEHQAAGEFLGWRNFSANDGRLGHIMLFIPNYNARIELSTLEKENLRIEVNASVPFDSLVLELDWSDGVRNDRKRIILDSAAQMVPLKFAPTVLNVWLKSREGDVFDYLKDNSYWARGANAVLPRLQPGIPSWNQLPPIAGEVGLDLEDDPELSEEAIGPTSNTDHKFLAAGSQHDAYREIRNIVQQASSEIMIIDPYVDDSLWMLLTNVPSLCKIRLLTQTMKADFRLEGRKF
jgi:hypothetical protein